MESGKLPKAALSCPPHEGSPPREFAEHPWLSGLPCIMTKPLRQHSSLASRGPGGRVAECSGRLARRSLGVREVDLVLHSSLLFVATTSDASVASALAGADV
eukprot:602608-Alexandrium_andersonii.AAC.1